MKPCSVFIFLIKLFTFHLKLSVFAAYPPYEPLENVALDCGSSGLHTSSFDGRNWTNDATFISQSQTNSTATSMVSSIEPGVPQVPYKTARLFFSEFTYTFNLTPGPKFLRLHFYPTSYPGFDASKAFLSVTGGDHTLLSNFSASLAANYKNVYVFFKEFIVHVQNHSLRLTFSPSSNASDAFAFVNGIELVSMPLNLYIRGENVPLPFVGYPYNPIRLDTTYALETVYRINVGGDDISPKSDTGMFRTWIKDDQYLYGAADGQLAYDYGLQVKYTPMVPAYTAPDLVYRTARFMGFDSRINLNFNLSWFFPVETGFLYLVRLHFCELDRNMTKINKKVFSIYMNNETAQPQADVIGWSGGQGVPVYKDYVVMIPQGKNGIQDLWLDLHPSTETRPQYYQSFLNGVEIFRLNYYGGNLAVPNNPQLQYHEGPLVNSSSISSSTISSKKRLAKIIGGSAGGLVMAFIIVCSLAFWIRVANERAKKKNKSPFRYFTMKEIKAATNNFDEGRIIGTGGFGVVYKGYIDGETTTVAVKRSNKAQGHNEFQSEIKTLSLLRHQNVVSLMGYCSDEQEMILVYEYMPKGTLFEHLHFSDEQQKMPLSWNQRLHICIGAAQGLCYLHTGMKFQIVHRDVKTSNILLDENWVAKIADFGLSKIDPTNGSTKVMGSIGYIDPEYCRLLKLTDKSDVYSFGVVLLEVLSAKFVVNYNSNDNEENEDAVSFVEWALNCYEKGDLENLIDPHLEGKITPASLAKFMEITQKCLAEQGLDRPSISQVLWSLELALELQIHGNSEDRKVISGNSDLTLGVEFSEIMMPIGR